MTNSESPTPAPTGSRGLPGGLLIILGLAAITLIALVFLYDEGVSRMLKAWEKEEYNHGYLIPFVAIYLLWLRAREMKAASLAGSWWGIALVIFSIALLTLGELSAVYTLSQIGFIIAIWGLALAAAGVQGLRYLWVPLLYLAFMIPLPQMIEQKLTADLQLISSQIGVAVIRAANLTVHLDGNVIDLGSYKLQVAEACSGMRYLFPLMSFGFLCAVLFRGRWWQRGILLLSTVPITILMNSFRIGVIGILVNFYGIEQAEGFLHDFEGWVVFMACVGILFMIVWIFARMNGQRFLEAFGLDLPPLGDLTGLLSGLRPNRQVLTGIGIVLAALLVSLTITRPPMLVPERQSLSLFPLSIGDWRGQENYVDQIYIDQLQVTDHMMSQFRRPADEAPVDMWIAYYDSQVTGVSVHSPQACLPGGGWQIQDFRDYDIPDVGPDGSALRVNRAVIAMGDVRQLVYYWFPQRGRNISSEYLVKWYIFWDGLTMNRTDGALVRLSTFVADPARMEAADQRLTDFIRTVDPRLAYHIPGADAPVRDALAAAASVGE